jgi:hypothetical protein
MVITQTYHSCEKFDKNTHTHSHPHIIMHIQKWEHIKLMKSE